MTAPEGAQVAADTELVRHSTPRRCLTVLEDLRGRRVAILPTVAHELRGRIPLQAAAYVRGIRERDGKWSGSQIQTAARAAGAEAAEWWEDWRLRNDSIHEHVPDPGTSHYSLTVASLPDEAFLDTDGNDQLVHAQAWAHGIDILASRNRRSVVRKELERHFAALDGPLPPIEVRNLHEHTTAVAGTERRDVSEVALEAMPFAVIPEDWTSGKHVGVRSSCDRFIRNLNTAPGRRVRMTAEGNTLSRMLDRAVQRLGHAAFIERCEAAYAIRPAAAREAGKRFHGRTRAAVRWTGIDPWA